VQDDGRRSLRIVVLTFVESDLTSLTMQLVKRWDLVFGDSWDARLDVVDICIDVCAVEQRFTFGLGDQRGLSFGRVPSGQQQCLEGLVSSTIWWSLHLEPMYES
jgi:hypothetical protein